jgi:hypothetical protein
MNQKARWKIGERIPILTRTCGHPEERRHHDPRWTDGFTCGKCGLWLSYEEVIAE